MYVNVISDHQAIIKQSSSDHTTTKANSRTLLKTTSVFFYLLFTMICFPTFSKKFFWKKFKIANVTMDIQAIIKRSSSDHPTTKANSRTLFKTTSGFFYLIFTIICFPTLSKKFFWKKLKNVNVTSHHQAIINNNIIIRSWNSEQSWLLQKFIGGVYLFVPFQNFSGWEKTQGDLKKFCGPHGPPRSALKFTFFSL